MRPTKHALRDSEWIAQNPKAKTDDWMGAFADPDVHGIFSIIAGKGAINILPYINLNCIA